ncbi:MAG: aminotransferase class V-fold PLP-dependent enzyme [Clostridia bacterium]|nr:aminotransferase class V-fold PLP-dependent enzyme [Clostridia bacterium]
MIFLDNASTTKLCSKALKNLNKYSTEKFYNPSSIYSVGIENFNKIIDVKELICEKLNVKFNNNIIFTGSATEASNLAISGSYKKSFKKIIVSKGEHPSVFNVALNKKLKGAQVEFINLQKSGEIDYEHFESLLDNNVNFISIIHISNETGAINDLNKICNIKNKKCPNAILHIDGVQAFGKIETDLSENDVDFYTISAHKLHGPKGLGVLYVKNPNKLQTQIWGGGQEYNLRSGTENLASIMAFKSAIENIGDIEKSFKKVLKLNNAFKKNLFNLLDEKIKIKFMQNDNLSPYIMSFCVPGIKGETLLRMCDNKGLLISTGSACSSKKSGNRILEAIGYSKKEIEGNVRVSFSKQSTSLEIKNGSEILASCINELYFKMN